MMYQILSPDGFSITHDAFRSKKKALEAFKQWVKGFETQGYYLTARWEKIPLVDLPDCCELIAVERAEGGMR